MMPKLYKKCFHKSLKTFLTIAVVLYIISDKCIDCLSFHESVAAAYTATQSDQIELNFSILEGVPIGTLIGVIKSSNSSLVTQPPYLIVPVSSGAAHKSNSSKTSIHLANSGGSVETDLNIDQTTGELRTAVQLDREQQSYYEFIAIPLTGANIKVTITIEDINDNAPQFPTKDIDLELPENSKPRDVKRTLPPARDLDLELFGTQKYRIVSGNIGNAFRLLSHREKDDVLYLDLQVNRPLDRETISNYTLVIEALDGGQPPLKDEMIVRIQILDHNDCEPVFNQSHYYASVAENATTGTSLLRVSATDNDQGDNGLVTYSIHSQTTGPSGVSAHFGIEKRTGWIYVTKSLDFESKEVHEFVVIASDSGAQPLETSAVVSIQVTDVNDNQPTIGLLYLTENASPEIRENAKVGDLVARVSVNDADSTDSITNSDPNSHGINGLSVALSGGDGRFGLTTQNNGIYLIVVTGPLDRKKKSRFNLTVIVTDQGSPPLNTTNTFELEVTDINDPRYFTKAPELPEVKSGDTPGSAVLNATNGNTATNTTTTTIAINNITTSTNTSNSNITAPNATTLEIEITDFNDNSAVLKSTKGPELGEVRNDGQTPASGNSMSVPVWVLFLIILLMLVTVVLSISIVVIRLNQHQQNQHLMGDHVRHIGPHNIGSLLRKIGPLGGGDPNHNPYHNSHYGSAIPAPPCYNDVTLSSSAVLAQAEGYSASSGRGSAEDEAEVEADMDDVDEEIRMINENNNFYGEDGDSDVTTTAEYLARLGVVNHHEDEREESSTALEDEDDDLDQLGAISTPRISSIRGHRTRTTSKTEDWPQMCGSLSSIVHSEEELSGSYNWDYLQHWGPKYQPLASVFAEIARLKASNGEQDLTEIEAMAVENGSTRSSSTASSSQRSQRSSQHRHHIPVHMSARISHPTPAIASQINAGFQSLTPINSSPNIENIDRNNGLTVDEEIRI